MKYSLFFVIYILFCSFIFSQESNMEEFYELSEILKKKKVVKFLKYSIHKDNKKPDQFLSAGIIEIYKDSLIYYKFVENVYNEIVRTRRIILDKKIINYTNLYFNDFHKYKPKCYQKSFFYKKPLMKPPPNFSKNKVGFSKKQWNIYSFEINREGNYAYKTSFKSKLFKFKCLGFFKNLKSRKMFKRLLKYPDDADL